MRTSINCAAEPDRVALAAGSLPFSLAQRLAAGVRRLWTGYWDDQLRRATVRMLETLDDRTLRDIGLARREIAHAVHGESRDARALAPPGKPG